MSIHSKVESPYYWKNETVKNDWAQFTAEGKKNVFELGDYSQVEAT